jgi:hypothetical protein
MVNGSRLISFVKVDQVQNRATHFLVNYARAEANTNVWLGTWPEILSQELNPDLVKP